MLKRVIISLFIFLFLKNEGVSQQNIFVLKSEANPFYNSILSAFGKWCDCKLDIYDMEGKIEKGKELIKKERDKIDIGVAVGTLAMKAFNEELPEKNILCLLCMDPEYLNIPPHKVSGVSVFLDEEEVSEALVQMLSETKKVGVLISEKMKNLQKEISEAFLKRNLKMNLLISTNPMDSLLKIKDGEFDILYLLPDPQILNPSTYQAIVKILPTKNFIMIAPSPIYLKLGGHIAFNPDLERAGKEGAKIFKEISSGGGRFIRCPIKEVILNEKAMENKKYKSPKGLELKTTGGTP
jgi:ABC-type uncharacterized transport system substrate-binding protein